MANVQVIQRHAHLALLSIVWMAGVLAAQLHGAVAVVRLLGAGSLGAHALAIALIFVASLFALRAASLVFAGCLAASAIVLLFALVTSGGIAVYATSLPAFAQALPSLGVAQAFTIAIGVGLLVCTGADYHQFVLAARAPGAAVRGCLLAGVGLLLLAFLPPAVVLSAIAQPSWPGVADAKQVVPQALSLAAADLAMVAAPVMLGVLGVAALGSGAAVLRAMVSALQAARPDGASASPLVLAAIAMAVATALSIDHAMFWLCTYLGHAKISDTYWYLTGVPELMDNVGAKFERFALEGVRDE